MIRLALACLPQYFMFSSHFHAKPASQSIKLNHLEYFRIFHNSRGNYRTQSKADITLVQSTEIGSLTSYIVEKTLDTSEYVFLQVSTVMPREQMPLSPMPFPLAHRISVEETRDAQTPPSLFFVCVHVYRQSHRKNMIHQSVKEFDPVHAILPGIILHKRRHLALCLEFLKPTGCLSTLPLVQ